MLCYESKDSWESVKNLLLRFIVCIRSLALFYYKEQYDSWLLIFRGGTFGIVRTFSLVSKTVREIQDGRLYRFIFSVFLSFRLECNWSFASS